MSSSKASRFAVAAARSRYSPPAELHSNSRNYSEITAMSDWAAKLSGANSDTRHKNTVSRKSSSPEPYNHDEVVEFLHSRYQQDLSESREKDDTVVYRSLEASSGWSSRKVEEFNLLNEINRSLRKS